MDLIFIFVIFTSAFLVCASKEYNTISSIFEGFGYSPVCVASALASCELSAQKGFVKNTSNAAFPSIEPPVSQMYCNKHINDSLGLIISNLQEIEQNTKLLKHESEINKSGIQDSQKDYYMRVTSALSNVSDSLAHISASILEIEKNSKLQRPEDEIRESAALTTESLAIMAAKLIESKENKNKPLNCYEIRESGDTASGVRTIYPLYHSENKSLEVYCDQTTDGGGWTVFQRRDALPIREDFYRNWTDYALGFGNLKGEFWLGLENLHALTSYTQMHMRVDLADYEGAKRWAKYGKFSVGDSSSKYALNIGLYSGDAGDDMIGLNGMKFSTHEQDHDTYAKNCAVEFRGAWWYSACHGSNLNGYQYVGKHVSFADGIIWKQFRDYYYSLKMTSMKIRPTS